MRTLRCIVSTLFLVSLGALALPGYSSAQEDAPAPLGQAIDSTKKQSNICELHRAAMSKRTVPIAYGMIPMSRVEAERGEWKRRTDYYPHPGDCLPATDINLTGEKRAIVFVCPKCEAAKKDMEKVRTARTAAAVWPPDPTACEAAVQKYETSAMWDRFEGGGFMIYDAVVFKIVSPAPKAGQEVRAYVEAGALPADSALRKPGARYRFDFDFALLKQEDQLFLGAFKNLEREETSGAGLPQRLLGPIDTAVLARIQDELARLEKAAKEETSPGGFPPSSQTAYYLLAGLAARGTAMEGLSESEQRLFDAEGRGGVRARLISVFINVRVALLDHWIQDKAGTYLHQIAVLYVQQDGKWLENGKGALAAPSYQDL